jgi:translation initiation factor 2D
LTVGELFISYGHDWIMSTHDCEEFTWILQWNLIRPALQGSFTLPSVRWLIFGANSVRSLYLASEIRAIVTTYIESESLVINTNRRLVKIDPVLANVVFDSDSLIDREVVAKGTVPRDQISDRVLQNCSPFWALLKGNETKDDVKPKAGKAPNIQIVLETRSGNKTVTKVSGMETYHVSPAAFAVEMQKACASSTSVGQLVGSSPKQPIMEVMVQGPQTQAVIKALEKEGVNRQWIDVVDKTKGKKK